MLTISKGDPRSLIARPWLVPVFLLLFIYSECASAVRVETQHIHIKLVPRGYKAPANATSVPDCPPNPDEVLRIVLKPRGSNSTTNSSTTEVDNNSLCGLEEDVDPERLLSEWNGPYIFQFLAKEDSNPRHATKVFEVVSFTPNGLIAATTTTTTATTTTTTTTTSTAKNTTTNTTIEASQAPATPAEPEEDPSLFSLFIAPPSSACDPDSLKAAATGAKGFFSVFIGTQNNFSSPKQQFLDNMGCLTTEYGGKKPKLCATKLFMLEGRGESRKATLEGLFNFPYNVQRKVRPSKFKMCTSKQSTKDTFAAAYIFDTTSPMWFGRANKAASESDGFARALVFREHAQSKAIGNLKTSIPQTKNAATEDDFVSYDGPVVFQKGQTSVEVYIGLKRDDIVEEDEIIELSLEPSVKTRKKRKTTKFNYRVGKLLTRRRVKRGANAGKRASVMSAPAPASACTGTFQKMEMKIYDGPSKEDILARIKGDTTTLARLAALGPPTPEELDKVNILKTSTFSAEDSEWAERCNIMQGGGKSPGLPKAAETQDDGEEETQDDGEEETQDDGEEETQDDGEEKKRKRKWGSAATAVLKVILAHCNVPNSKQTPHNKFTIAIAELNNNQVAIAGNLDFREKKNIPDLGFGETDYPRFGKLMTRIEKVLVDHDILSIDMKSFIFLKNPFDVNHMKRHAEMQLTRYAKKNGFKIMNFGVSKPPCCMCDTVLSGEGMMHDHPGWGHYTEAANGVTVQQGREYYNDVHRDVFPNCNPVTSGPQATRGSEPTTLQYGNTKGQFEEQNIVSWHHPATPAQRNQDQQSKAIWPEQDVNTIDTSWARSWELHILGIC